MIIKPFYAYKTEGAADYQFNFIPSKPILSLRESYDSGGKKKDDKIYSFEFAFGAQDKFYGWMNVTTWPNLDDREIVLELSPLNNEPAKNAKWFALQVVFTF